ncbi:STM3941 family protein [Chryseobacterium sp.]|uniref:STM3941 family protein n=1 Tax=Chryseobacterium sp. TaxID=1871047 RepID=UPI00388D4E80
MKKEPILLKPSKLKSILLSIISITFVILGVTLLEKNLLVGILNIVFFGICFAVFIIQILPSSSYLKINEQGIEMKNLFKTTFIPWESVSDFRTKNFFINKMVVFDIEKKFLENDKIKPKTGAFPDTYGMSALQLAQLLNDYKNEYQHL